MEINKICSKNLYHVVKKHNLMQRELCDYLNANPNSKRVIGTLPYDWIKDVPKSEIPLMVEKVDDVFSKFSEMISPIKTHDSISAIRGAKVRLKKFHRQLQTDLQQILKREDISVEYTGGGAFKHCHKLSVGKFKYALSTFLKHKPGGTISDYFNEYKQGRGYEPQNSFTLYKNGEHGRCAKPFLAKITRENDFDGFILAKFIDSTRKPKFIQGTFERMHSKIKNEDFAERNFIKGVFIDVGGSFLNPEYIKDKKLRNLWQGCARRFDETNSLFRNYQIKRLDSVIVEDFKKNRNIFDKNYINFLSYRFTLTKKTKKDLRKFITNLNYANKMRKKAEEEGIKGELVKILNEDLKKECPYKTEVWYGLEDKYYSKAFANVLGISNKLSPKELIATSQYLPLYDVKNDYTRAEIIAGMNESWHIIKGDRALVKKIRKLFDIDDKTYNEIKKNNKNIRKK